jgi:DNA-binding SARP family transcriptional activator
MEIRLLGPLEVRDGDRVVTLPRRQQRALVAALALRAGEVVSSDRLVADLWGERPPASATGSLQNTVHGLRKLLGRDVLVTQAPGYRLAVAADAVDANRFEHLLAEARGAEPAERARLLREALDLWSGPALSDLDEEAFARLEAGRLDELRLSALEERIDADLELGRHAGLVAELEQLVATNPLRERLRGQLMLVLYRRGRQAEALEVYRAARLALADELGLDPSPELQELERRVLRQDPGLAEPQHLADTPAADAAERTLVTALAAVPPTDDDPERHRALLDETLAAVQQALGRNGGSLERFGPEGLLALFGADAAGDDDALRAFATAEELGLPAGIATGEMVGGAGAVVNRAVELARAGGVTLDERTRALVETSSRAETPLVGRTRELARLAGALHDPSCRIVTVVGEPGIGKTRLARELARRAGEPTSVLVARCLSYGTGATFGPLIAALGRAEPDRALAGQPDVDLVLARLAALGEAAPLGESYWAIRRLLEALAPALLILDDVHWAEPALLDLVEYLGERAAGQLLVLCLTRPELDRLPGELLQLEPLADADARALVPPELDAATQDRIVELAEGNALYVEQLSSYAAEGGDGLPPTLEAVLAGRLGRVAPAERATLQRAAVVGREFSRAAVAALCDEPVDAALSALSRRGFLHPAESGLSGDDGYRFHHVLLRDTAYGTLTKAVRAELHERAAAWLARGSGGDDALVGYHLEQAVGYRRELGEDADGLAVAAGERLGAAGMQVWRSNNVNAAVGLLGRATQLLPAGSGRAALLWEHSLALRLHGDGAQAEEALAEAEANARAASDRAVIARVEAERAGIGLATGGLALDEVIAILAASAAVLRSEGDERGLGRAIFTTCMVHAFACNLAAQATAAEEAAVHYATAGFSPAACHVSYVLALYDGSVDVGTAAARCAELLEAAGDAMTEANTMSVLGALRAWAGAADEGLALLDHARSLYEDIGSRRGVTFIWTPARIDAEIAAGMFASAAERAEANVDELRRQGELAYACTRSLMLAELWFALRDDDAAEHATAFGESTALPSDVLAQFLGRSMRARLLAREGQLERAETVAREAVSIASLTDALRYRAIAHAALAEVLTRKGDGDSAQVEEAVAAELLRRKGVKGALAGAPST